MCRVRAALPTIGACGYTCIGFQPCKADCHMDGVNYAVGGAGEGRGGEGWGRGGGEEGEGEGGGEEGKGRKGRGRGVWKGEGGRGRGVGRGGLKKDHYKQYNLTLHIIQAYSYTRMCT